MVPQSTKSRNQMTSTLQGISYDSNFASESVSEYNSRRESMMCELIFSRFMVFFRVKSVK